MDSKQNETSVQLLNSVARHSKPICDAILLFAGLEIDTRYNGKIMTSRGHEKDLKELEISCKYLDTAVYKNRGEAIYPAYVMTLAEDVVAKLSTLRDNDHFKTYIHNRGIDTPRSARYYSSSGVNRSKQSNHVSIRDSGTKMDISSGYTKNLSKRDTERLFPSRISKDRSRSNTRYQRPPSDARHEQPKCVRDVTRVQRKNTNNETVNQIQDTATTVDQQVFGTNSRDNVVSETENESHKCSGSDDFIDIGYDGEEI